MIKTPAMTAVARLFDKTLLVYAVTSAIIARLDSKYAELNLMCSENDSSNV